MYSNQVKEKMKKIIVIGSLISAILMSCTHNPQATSQSDGKQKLGDFNIKVIDDCEYIEYSHGFQEYAVYSITHKGNCKFCIERQENMFDKFLKQLGIK